MNDIIFGRWTVIKKAQEKTTPIKYDCICKCGNKEQRILAELKRGAGQSCSSCNPVIRFNIINEIGKKYGKWTVLEKIDCPMKTKSKPLYFKCMCECGEVSECRFTNLRSGRSTQCRSCRDKEMYTDVDSMIGNSYGYWTVESVCLVKSDKRKLICICKCGKKSTISASILKLGQSKKCIMCSVKKHGYEGSKTYTTWSAMKARCTNKNNDNYFNYGGRGITFCERWNKFENFLEDMGERPEDMELDRIDNEGNYESNNCRWVTKSQNALNRRKRKTKRDLSVS